MKSLAIWYSPKEETTKPAKNKKGRGVPARPNAKSVSPQTPQPGTLSVAQSGTPSAIDTSDNIKVDIHLNYWRIPKRGFKSFIKSLWSSIMMPFSKKDYLKNKKQIFNSFQRFLDIGLMISDYQQIEDVCLYLPFEITEKEVQDLWNLVGDKDLVNAIFNEDYKVQGEGNANYHVIFNSEEKALFHVCKIKNDKAFSCSKGYGGTIIKIKISELGVPTGLNSLYLRFRINSPHLVEFSSEDKPTNSKLQSAFSLSEILDFRLNEKRILDNDLLGVIAKGNSFYVNKLHFFLICCAQEEYVFSNKVLLGCRRLEKDIWKKYIILEGESDRVNLLSDKDTVLAYHWSEKEYKNDFKILVKTKFEHNNILTIGSYLLYLGLFTIAFNVCSSGLMNWWSGDYTNKQLANISNRVYKIEQTINKKPEKPDNIDKGNRLASNQKPKKSGKEGKRNGYAYN
ncbi:MAG: hypothetical protein ACM3MI_02850 [Clostridiales bacterium]